MEADIANICLGSRLAQTTLYLLKGVSLLKLPASYLLSSLKLNNFQRFGVVL